MKTCCHLLSLSVLILLATLSSCSNDDETDVTDLTSDIVGTYTGRYLSDFLEIDSEGERIKVTKVDDSRIRITPIDDGFTEAFDVILTKVNGGYTFTIPEQNSIYIGEIRGYDGPDVGEDNHGAYVTATGELVYGIWLTVGGVDYREIYIAYKD